MVKNQAKVIFSVPAETRDRFKLLAEGNHRTMSAELRRLMELAIAEDDARVDVTNGGTTKKA